MPFRVADAVIGRGRRVVLLALTGWADPAQVERYRHHWAHLGQLGRLSRIARQEGCRDVVFIGALTRPPSHSFASIWPRSWSCPVSSRRLRR